MQERPVVAFAFGSYYRSYRNSGAI